MLEVDGKVVGFVNVGITDDEEYKNQEEIFALYMTKKYKGNGCGRKLTEISHVECVAVLRLKQGM